ncbi:MAG: ankyrin repeat domain-containing protein [Myxococcota bacterium]|jgi:ankyrin repeat protein|nr:ankyrin repeat domain-containing protein [Myxococcota bacterium]
MSEGQRESWLLAADSIRADDAAGFGRVCDEVPPDRISQLAVIAVHNGSTRVLAWWLEHGLEPNLCDSGVALLQRAAGAGQPEAVRLLLAAGATLDGVPLVAAASSGSLECVRLLLEAGADIELGYPGFPSPLGAAEAKGHREVARYLTERGATRRVGA